MQHRVYGTILAGLALMGEAEAACVLAGANVRSTVVEEAVIALQIEARKRGADMEWSGGYRNCTDGEPRVVVSSNGDALLRRDDGSESRVRVEGDAAQDFARSIYAVLEADRAADAGLIPLLSMDDALRVGRSAQVRTSEGSRWEMRFAGLNMTDLEAMDAFMPRAFWGGAVALQVTLLNRHLLLGVSAGFGLGPSSEVIVESIAEESQIEFEAQPERRLSNVEGGVSIRGGGQWGPVALRAGLYAAYRSRVALFVDFWDVPLEREDEEFERDEVIISGLARTYIVPLAMLSPQVEVAVDLNEQISVSLITGPEFAVHLDEEFQAELEIPSIPAGVQTSIGVVVRL